MIDILSFAILTFGIYQWFKVIGMLEYNDKDDDPPPSSPAVF